ncbi:MAG: BglG family transcription antiterminator LicT [Acetivibrionales bacterium]
MKVIKIINNNIVSSLDENGNELVVMGRGLGFQAKSGQMIDESKVEKVFRMETNEQARRLGSLLADMPIEYVQLVNSIISEAKKTIDKEMNKNLYITLIDHIGFAIERCKQGIEFSNPLLWEIKKFYPQEFKVGQKAVSIINSRFNTRLTEHEAASIAMHFVNAELGSELPEVMDITKIIQDVLKIVKYHFNVVLDEESLSYERFITHLKFFSQRIVTGTNAIEANDELNSIIKSHYPYEYKCAQKIKKYINDRYHAEVSEEEMTYLTIHIKRVTSVNKKHADLG